MMANDLHFLIYLPLYLLQNISVYVDSQVRVQLATSYHKFNFFYEV
jgi:hypothetical protein